MGNKFDQTKASKANTAKTDNKYLPVSKKKKLITSEFKKVVGGKRNTDDDPFDGNHNEIFVTASCD